MSTDIGDTLRDYVIELLEADGHRLTREPRVNTKRIDIVLNLDDEYVSRKIAIECKNVDHNLSQNELALIYADYLSLVERKSIHEVWVVVRRSYSPEALNWARERSNFEVFTLSEFEERRHGFRSFVRQLSGMFSEGGLDKYYVPQRVGTGKQLEQVVFDWIESDDPRPMALLGGYGMGKTSVCRFLVAELGKRYLEDPMKRVPVFIRLADIAKQQELSGLIAKTLAERYRVKDYHFEKFRKLNEMGKLVLIFDGFDEMKHALSWWEFKYNFSQINSVVKGRAKVIIAGRPNAFLSDFEHDWVLRGIRVAGEQRVRLPEWPEYIEVEMEPFSKDEAKLFLHRYLGAQLRGSDSLTQAETDWIEKRVAEFNDLKRRDELLRPVHLKIFSDIAADRSIVLRDFSIFELYNIATTRISEREGEKVERALIDPEVRQECIEGIAWWLWDGSGGRALSFNPTDVPFTLIDLAFVGSSDHSVEGMYREIFSGPFVERKLGENYYFAHRSFLEFFVAKKLSRSREQKFSLGLISKNLNPEIISFMREGKLLTQFLNYALDAMQAFSGELEFYLLDAIQKYVDETGKKPSDMQLSAEMILRYLFLYANESIEGLIERWPAPGSADTELGVLMDLEVGHGETKIYAGVQA